MIIESDLWSPGLDSVRDGEVFTWDGRRIGFRSLVQRRWGWPKKSAHAAADWIVENSPNPAILWLNNPHRSRQQEEVIAAIPELFIDLCSGLARGGSINVSKRREFSSLSRMINGVMVSFDVPITDDGLVRGVINVLANRLGCSPEELRSETHYDTTGDLARIRVRTSAFKVPQ
jgi:hypothetical protein